MSEVPSNQLILLTGATGGIGLEIAKTLAASGHALVITGRNDKLLSSLAMEIQHMGGTVSAYACDLTIDKEVESLVKYVGTIGKLKGLVNNAGKELLLPLQATSRVQMQNMFEINVLSMIYLTKCCLKLLGRNSSIVNISSVSAIRGSPGLSIYAATKGAINSFTKSLAIELASRGIRVNAIAPGLVATAMSERMMSLQGEEYRTAIASKHPLGIGTPLDVANVVDFLISDRSRWITGSIVGLDGGFST